jgi:hypothetical protein
LRRRLGKQVDRHKRHVLATRATEDTGDSLQRVGVKTWVPEWLPRIVREAQLDPHPRAVARQPLGLLALSDFNFAVCGQRGSERAPRPVGHFKAVMNDALAVRCDQDAHRATRPLKPAEQGCCVLIEGACRWMVVRWAICQTGTSNACWRLRLGSLPGLGRIA